MRWLLDTNVVSDNVRDRPNPVVAAWMSATTQADTAISIVTLAELLDGATSAKDEDKRQRLIHWVNNEVALGFQDRILQLTADVLVHWIRLSRKLSARGRTRDPSDLLIAATAGIHNLVLATRNVRDFEDTGIVVYDPWTDTTHRMEQP
jgi:predicted nucleic acid-binding protein